MNYRERIRKAIACPQFGNETYGEWGILNLEQRSYIKRLLDELDSADNYFKMVYLENQELKEKYENAIADYENAMFEKNELKKQLEEYKKKLMRITKMEIKQIDEATFVGIDYFQDKCIVLKAQQKEFIKWLEDIIDSYKYSNLDDYKNVLQKYKEIIGDDK